MNEVFNTLLCDESKVYGPDDVPGILAEVRPNFRFSWMNTKVKYFNVPAAFDIETSSFYQDGEKCASMYIWQAGIYGRCVIGRTWKEFIKFCNDLAAALDLDPERKRFIIYVHNLNYEFQFMRKYFTWYKVFAIDKRKPVYAITTTGIEFRCSYLLSGYNLQKVGENLITYKIQKRSGDLDYSKLRHCKTPLTPDEIGYCIADIKVVMAYIQEQIEKNGGIAKIPLTKTGYVRKYCRDSCFYDPELPRKKSFKRLRYREIVGGMKLDPDEYLQLQRAFQGGFTHCNYWKQGMTLLNVASYDFTSSYPAVMVAEQFPMSCAELVEITSKDEFYKNLKLYCCLFDIELVNLRPRAWNESYLSRSRCWLCEGAMVNNGRIFSARRVRTTITEQDFYILKYIYRWDKIVISNFRRYRKSYLPTDFVKAILELYRQKTELKGVEGKEAEYIHAKELLNSCYGMIVTNIVRDTWTYFDDWPESPEVPDLEIAISKYNKNPGRFLFYPWGVWVTAYARANLFSGILHFKSDYIYSDTDSLKVLHGDYPNHRKYIDDYNSFITEKLREACRFHKIPIDAICPKTIKGEEKPLGVWDYEGTYYRFKSLGAKRYMTETDGKISITVAGLNKKKTVPWLLDTFQDPFEAFAEDLNVPADHTGKMTHTYIDEERRGIITDYRGESAEFRELSAVHLEPGPYNMSLAAEYVDFLKDVRYTEV